MNREEVQPRFESREKFTCVSVFDELIIMASLAAEGGENAKASGPPESVQLNGKSYSRWQMGTTMSSCLGLG